MSAEVSGFVRTDGKSRVVLPGHPNQQFLYTQNPDGTLLLEPAQVVSELELRFLANAALRAQIEHAREHPEDRVKRKPRRARG